MFKLYTCTKSFNFIKGIILPNYPLPPVPSLNLRNNRIFQKITHSPFKNLMFKPLFLKVDFLSLKAHNTDMHFRSYRELKNKKKNINICILCLGVCLFVSSKRWKRLNKFCVGPHITPGKVNEWSKYQKLASGKCRFLLNFKNPPKFFFTKSANFFVFCFVYNVYKEKIFAIEIENEREAPWKL